MRCGAVRCGAVRCGAVRCGAVRCGAVRCGAVRCGALWICYDVHSSTNIYISAIFASTRAHAYTRTCIYDYFLVLFVYLLFFLLLLLLLLLMMMMKMVIVMMIILFIIVDVFLNDDLFKQRDVDASLFLSCRHIFRSRRNFLQICLLS